LIWKAKAGLTGYSYLRGNLTAEHIALGFDSLLFFSQRKPVYKRNAFGNHSKGIINLNLKLNYEKIFCCLQLYILIPYNGEYYRFS